MLTNGRKNSIAESKWVTSWFVLGGAKPPSNAKPQGLGKHLLQKVYNEFRKVYYTISKVYPYEAVKGRIHLHYHLLIYMHNFVNLCLNLGPRFLWHSNWNEIFLPFCSD